MAEGLAEGLEKGLAKGIVEGLYMVASRMKQSGLDIESIISFTGLSAEEIDLL